MRWYALLAIPVVLICGCASQGSATGARASPKTQDAAPANRSGQAANPGTAPNDGIAQSKAGNTAEAGTPSAASHGSSDAETAPKRAAAGVAPKKTRATRAVVTAVGGGLSNGAVGAYMDSQKHDLQKSLHDEILSGSARVDKLAHNIVRIRMPTRTAFESNSSSLKPQFCPTMDKLADVVTRYGKTTLTVVGRFDSDGPGELGRKLSQRRALTVVQYLESKEVNPVRLAALGMSAGDAFTSNGRDPAPRDRIEILVEPVVAR